MHNKSGKYIIGVGGLARAGKDTACALLLKRFEKRGISAKRIALADRLKAELRDELLEKYKIDVLNCSPEEKESIRPELVAFGKIRRQASDGTFWTNSLEQSLLQGEITEDVIIVPDIRYDVYEKDERYWVQEKMQGVLLHVSRYTRTTCCGKQWIQPPNQDEAENDPKLRAAADFIIEWETAPPERLEALYGIVFEGIVNCARTELQRTRR